MSVSLSNMFSFVPSSLYKRASALIQDKDKRIGLIVLSVFVAFYLLYALSRNLYSSQNFPDGTKKITYWSGLIIEGTLANGKLEGKGKKTYPNGTIEEGVFSKGILEGLGKKIHPDGTIEEGIFKKGKLEDEHGKITHLDYIEKGKFVNGEFVMGLIRSKGWEQMQLNKQRQQQV